MAALEVVKSMIESLRRRRTIGTRRKVELAFAAPKAKKACIAGAFNDWNSTSLPIKKAPALRESSKAGEAKKLAAVNSQFCM